MEKWLSPRKKVCGQGRKNGGQDIKVLCRSYRTWLLAQPGMAISFATEPKSIFISFCEKQKNIPDCSVRECKTLAWGQLRKPRYASPSPRFKVGDP